MDLDSSEIGRRRALTILGVLGLGAVAAACGSSGSSGTTGATGSGASTGSTPASSSKPASSTSSAAATAASTASSAGGVSCVTLTPEVTEGPYYLDLNDVRRDITEGRPGAALDLEITVIDSIACTPIEGAAVDLWHCDASGVYSGFQSGTGQTFLRGTQLTDASGVAGFATIVPGFYQGRAVHMHMKVHTGGSVVHTGQLFFDPGLLSTVFHTSPYQSHGTSPDTPNDADSIYRQAGGTSAIVATTPSGSGYAGTITVAVKQS
jgi:protocatechuate 3,4-dioxygenase beta subunit